jgi:hypothetical protein
MMADERQEPTGIIGRAENNLSGNENENENEER